MVEEEKKNLSCIDRLVVAGYIVAVQRKERAMQTCKIRQI